MSIETVDWITDLDPTNPPAGDPVAQAADHIRLIKGSLISTFPNMSGQVKATPDDLNNVLITTRGNDAYLSLPIYNSTTVASTIKVTPYGLSLLTLGSDADIDSKTNKTNFVLKTGDTMSGPLVAPTLAANTTVVIGDFTLKSDSGKLVFYFGGTAIATMSSAGIYSINEIQGFGL